MSGIIEKLGITPGPWIKDYGNTIGHIKSTAPHDKRYTPTVCKYDEFTQLPRTIVNSEIQANGLLIAAAPELLEHEINDIEVMEESLKYLPNNLNKKMHLRIGLKMITIQKITGKSWEEIKELLS